MANNLYDNLYDNLYKNFHTQNNDSKETISSNELSPVVLKNNDKKLIDGFLANSPKNIRVKKLILKEINGQQMQFIRPYVTNLNSEGVNLLIDYIDNGIKITPESIGGKLDNFMSLSSQTKGSIDIINGWNEKRFIFILFVDVISQLGSTSEIVTGYTDNAEHANRGSSAILPNELTFFINTIIRVRNSTIQDNYYGTKQVSSIIDNSHVFSNNAYRNSGMDYNLYSCNKSNVLAKMQDVDQNLSHVQRLNYPIDSRPQLASRLDSSLPYYFTSIVEPVRRNLNRTSQYDLGENQYNSWGDIYSAVRSESNIYPNEYNFLRLLNDYHGNMSVSFFTWGEINALDENTDNMTTIIFNGNEERYNNPLLYLSPGDSSGVGDNSIETQSALMLSTSIPTILMKYGIGYIDFTARNTTNDGLIHIIIKDIDGIVKQDVKNAVDILEHEIVHAILLDITRNNIFTLDLDVCCNVFSDTKLSIDLGNGKIPYVIPSFCDALFSPIITNDVDDIQKTALDFVEITGALDPQNRLIHSGLNNQGQYNHEKTDNSFNDDYNVYEIEHGQFDDFDNPYQQFN